MNGSLEEVISRLSAGSLNADSQTDQWTKLMRQCQSITEENVDNLLKGMSKLSTTVQGAEAMYQELQEKVGILESSNSKAWERLEMDSQRMSRLESSITGLDIKLDEKVEMIQEWFVHLSSQVPTDVPVEIVNSIQEVIADSSPGLAVNRMRVELDEIRGSLDSSRHITESLRGLVVDLSDQVVNSSMLSAAAEPRIQDKDSRSFKSHARERDVVRKSIERARKQLRQLMYLLYTLL